MIIGRLVEHSLVEVGETDGEATCRLLETVGSTAASCCGIPLTRSP